METITTKGKHQKQISLLKSRFFSLWIHLSKTSYTCWISVYCELGFCICRRSGYWNWGFERFFYQSENAVSKSVTDLFQHLSGKLFFLFNLYLNLHFVQWITGITLTFACHDFWMFKIEAFMLNWQMVCINIKLDLGKSFNL